MNSQKIKLLQKLEKLLPKGELNFSEAVLEEHAKDKREWLYSLEQLDQGKTHDPIWNAAQRQLRESGVMHNYLRMLWGKKVLEWSATPQEALEVAFHLNHRWALDGRDPNSASGVCWTFGRFDRPWAPERPIFGTVRYMSSANTKKKLDLARYLARWGPAAAQDDLGFS